MSDSAVPEPNRAYDLSPHERVTILRHTPELLEAEVHLEPGSTAPVAHRHPAQFERVLVLSGRVRLVVDGEQRLLLAGDTATIAKGRAHRLTADGPGPARMIWQTSPALATASWWASLDALVHAYGGVPPRPATARLLRRHRRELALALPTARVAVRLLALLPARAPRGPAGPSPAPPAPDLVGRSAS